MKLEEIKEDLQELYEGLTDAVCAGNTIEVFEINQEINELEVDLKQLQSLKDRLKDNLEAQSNLAVQSKALKSVIKHREYILATTTTVGNHEVCTYKGRKYNALEVASFKKSDKRLLRDIQQQLQNLGIEELEIHKVL